jgi:hypothetical protein
MTIKPMKAALLIAFFAAICLAQETAKPVCNAKTQGQFWPTEANSSPEAARRYTQSGELEMCARGVWKYKWEHLSINVHALAKSKQAATPEAKPTDASK